MITYDLSLHGNLPKYEYLYRCIRGDIRGGTLKENERLPSKRALANHLVVSVSTVESAYSLLVSEGYIYPKRGCGYFVSPGKSSDFHIPPYEEADGGEKKYRIDFKANKCSLSLFPMNTWTRLMRQVLSGQDAVLLETVPFNGLYVLRRAICEYLYEYRGMRVSPDQIIIGAGTEYLYGKLLQLFGTQCVIAIEEPGYKKFSDISGSFGTLWDYIPMDESGIRTDILAESRASVVHISPANHFPTGIVMPMKRRRELIEWAQASPSRYLIEDDYDSELRFSGQALPTVYSLDENDRVIYMNTFSKSLVPSLRISYMVLPKQLMDLYKKRLSFYSCSVSSFEQYTLAKFISEGYFERHIGRLKRHYRNRKEQIVREIQNSPLMSVCEIRDCRVGTHLILVINTRLSEEEIHNSAESKGIYLALMSDYCRSPSMAYSHQVILNFASIDPEKIPLAVELLVEIFREDIRSCGSFQKTVTSAD